MVGEEYEKDYNYCRSIDYDDATVNSLRSVPKCAMQWWQDYQSNLKNSSDEDTGLTGLVALRLTYPAGQSPNVFTTGWEFGASCISNGQDISDTVKMEWKR